MHLFLRLSAVGAASLVSAGLSGCNYDDNLGNLDAGASSTGQAATATAGGTTTSVAGTTAATASTAGASSGTGSSATGISGTTSGTLTSTSSTSGAVEAGCSIAGLDYAAGAQNPQSACQLCQPSVSADGWTNRPDGTGCGVGEICQAGACGGGCDIGGAIYGSGAANPNQSCESCQPALSTTAWSQLPNGTACGFGEICAFGSCSASCDIAGSEMVVTTGAANPMNACQSCQPQASTTAWTANADGTSCGKGQVCSGGACVSGCDIAGAIVPSGASNATNACEVCQPATSTTAWGNVADGASCGNGQICQAGVCGRACDIAGVDVASGASDPQNPCLACAPGTSTSAWTTVANGSVCDAGLVCASGACSANCFIDGGFVTPGTLNGACQSCQPALAVGTWSNLADGTGCGSGAICQAGACGSGCNIGGVNEISGATNSQNACQACVPQSSTNSWSAVADGTGCGLGLLCASGACSADCFIDGGLVTPGTLNGACQSCQPQITTSAWEPVADGTNCGSGMICQAGACSAACNIGGVDYASGQANPQNACQSCQPAASTTTWSSVADGTGCGSPVGGACQAGSCQCAAPTTGCFTPAVLTCVDEQIDSNNCGACNNPCGPGTTCLGSQCTTVAYAPVQTGWSFGYLGAALIGEGETLYIVGGASGGSQPTPLASAYAYSPVTNTWATLASLPSTRGFMASALGADGKTIYVFGGIESNSVTVNVLSDALSYSPATNTWTTLASMPTAVHAAAAATGLDGQIYVFGGLNTGGTQLSAVEAYDPSTNTWNQALPPLPTAQSYGRALTGPDGKIYVLGGANSSTLTLDIYDPATTSWTTGPSAACISGWAAAALSGSVILVSGCGYYTLASPTWTVQLAQGDGIANNVLNAVFLSDGRMYGLANYKYSQNGPSDGLVIYSPATGDWVFGPTEF